MKKSRESQHSSQRYCIERSPHAAGRTVELPASPETSYRAEQQAYLDKVDVDLLL